MKIMMTAAVAAAAVLLSGCSDESCKKDQAEVKATPAIAAENAAGTFNVSDEAAFEKSLESMVSPLSDTEKEKFFISISVLQAAELTKTPDISNEDLLKKIFDGKTPAQVIAEGEVLRAAGAKNATINAENQDTFSNSIGYIFLCLEPETAEKFNNAVETIILNGAVIEKSDDIAMLTKKYLNGKNVAAVMKDYAEIIAKNSGELKLDTASRAAFQLSVKLITDKMNEEDADAFFQSLGAIIENEVGPDAKMPDDAAQLVIVQKLFTGKTAADVTAMGSELIAKNATELAKDAEEAAAAVDSAAKSIEVVPVK